MREYQKRQINNRESADRPAFHKDAGISDSKLQEVLEGRVRVSDEMKGHRQDLAPSMAAKMSRAFGMDFSNLKVYRSSLMAREGGKGITSGNNIVLSKDLDLNTREGQIILGHELSHVRAQAQGIGIGRSGLLQDDSLEKKADHEGLLAAQGRNVTDGSTGMVVSSGMGGIGGLTPLGPGMGAGAGAPMQAWWKNRRAAQAPAPAPVHAPAQAPAQAPIPAPEAETAKEDDPFQYLPHEKREKKNKFGKSDPQNLNGFDASCEEENGSSSEEEDELNLWKKGVNDKPLSYIPDISKEENIPGKRKNDSSCGELCPDKSMLEEIEKAVGDKKVLENEVEFEKPGEDGKPEYSGKLDGLGMNRIVSMLNAELFDSMNKDEKVNFICDISSKDYDRVVKGLKQYRQLCYDYLKVMKKRYGNQLTQKDPSKINKKLGTGRMTHDTCFFQDLDQISGTGNRNKNNEQFLGDIKKGLSDEENEELDQLKTYYRWALSACKFQHDLDVVKKNIPKKGKNQTDETIELENDSNKVVMQNFLALSKSAEKKIKW